MTTTAPPRSKKTYSRIGLYAGLGVLAASVGVIAYVSANSRALELRASAENREQVSIGRLAYQQNCAVCHGLDLRGKPTWHKTVQGNALRAGSALNTVGDVWKTSDDDIYRLIARGDRPVPEGAHPVVIHPEPFGGKLTENQIWGLIAFMKSTWTVRQRISQEELSARGRGAGS